jgi:hypothetical protein
MNKTDPDSRMMRTQGQPTVQDLLAVVLGGTECVAGWRVLYALRFADGISFMLAGDPASDPQTPAGWELRDDVGTEFWGYGVIGSHRRQHLIFRTPPAAEASWVELVGPAGDALRVWL